MSFTHHLAAIHPLRPQERLPEAEPRDRRGEPVRAIRRTLAGACAALGIPVGEGLRLMAATDQGSLTTLLHAAAVEEQAERIVERLRSEQREGEGGREGPPLSDRIGAMGPLPPHVSLEDVVHAVLHRLHASLQP